LADDLLSRLPAAESASEKESRDQITRLNTARNLAMAIMLMVNPEHAWFWTPQWQARERAADRSITESRGTFYATGEDFLASLEART
jgi:hypothetical protein